MSFEFILFALLGGLASALHGRNMFSKGVVLLGSGVLASLLSYLLYGSIWAIVGTLIGTAIYWIFVRVGGSKRPFPMAHITLTYQRNGTRFDELLIALCFWGFTCAALLTYAFNLELALGLLIGVCLTASPLFTAMNFQDSDSLTARLLSSQDTIDNRTVFEFVSGMCFNGSLMLAGSNFLL